MFNSDMASRLSGEPRAVAHYIRTGVTGHEVRELEPNRYRKRKPDNNPYRWRRETPKEKRERWKPKPRAPKPPNVAPSKSLAPVPPNYGDFARKPFGKRGGLPVGSSGATVRQGLSRTGKAMLRRYQLPWSILQRIAQGNLTGSDPASKAERARQFRDGGWTVLCQSNVPVSLSPYTTALCGQTAGAPSYTPLCTTPNQVVTTTVPQTATNLTVVTTRTWMFGPASNFVSRFHVHEHYTRPLTGSFTLQFRRGAIQLPDDFELPPALDPMQLPIKQPVGTPVPIPYPVIPHRRPNPFRDPVEQSTGSEPSQEPQPAPAGPPIPPSYTPVDEIVIYPPPRPGRPPQMVGPKPAWHSRRPPRKGKEKENKVGNVPAGLARAAISLVTESADVAEAFYYAIPPKDRGFAPTPWDKAVEVWENLDKVQIPKLVGNLIIMLITDAAAGRWGRAQQQANRKLYDEFGIDLSGHLPKKYLQPEPDFE